MPKKFNIEIYQVIRSNAILHIEVRTQLMTYIVHYKYIVHLTYIISNYIHFRTNLSNGVLMRLSRREVPEENEGERRNFTVASEHSL